MTRLLVTGAAGFIGSHVCEALVARGEDVIGVDNFDPFYARAVKERNLEGLRRGPRFRFLETDVARDPLPWDGVDGVIHLAARPGVRPSLEDPAGYVTANVGGAARVLDGARRASGTIPILVTRWTASWPPWSGRPGPRREGCARRSTSGAVRGCGSTG